MTPAQLLDRCGRPRRGLATVAQGVHAGRLAFHVSMLERGGTSRTTTLLAFAESEENQQALANVIGNGFAYTPFGA